MSVRAAVNRLSCSEVSSTAVTTRAIERWRRAAAASSRSSIASSTDRLRVLATACSSRAWVIGCTRPAMTSRSSAVRRGAGTEISSSRVVSCDCESRMRSNRNSWSSTSSRSPSCSAARSRASSPRCSIPSARSHGVDQRCSAAARARSRASALTLPSSSPPMRSARAPSAVAGSPTLRRSWGWLASRSAIAYSSLARSISPPDVAARPDTSPIRARTVSSAARLADPLISFPRPSRIRAPPLADARVDTRIRTAPSSRAASRRRGSSRERSSRSWLGSWCVPVGGRVVLLLELGEERVDGRAHLGVVGETLADDSLGQLDREGADLTSELAHHLAALGAQLLVTSGHDAGRLLLGLGAQLLDDALRLGACSLADLGRLVARLGQLSLVLLERALGLGLGRLRPGDAALDRVPALAVDLLHTRPHETHQHEHQQRERDRTDDELAHRRDEDVFFCQRHRSTPH